MYASKFGPVMEEMLTIRHRSGLQLKFIGFFLDDFDQNLAKTGVYRYVESPVFEILLFSYSVDGSPVQLVDLACDEKIPAEVVAALTDDSVIKWTFNANFERICLSRYLGYPTGDYLEPDSWKCSAMCRLFP